MNQRGIRIRPRLVCALSLLLAQASIAVQAAALDAVPVMRGATWVSAASQPSSTTIDMRTLPVAPGWKPGDPILEIARRLDRERTPAVVPLNPVFGSDPLVAAQQNFPVRSVRAISTPLINIEALANSIVAPNDATGDIGPNQFVAAINSTAGAQFSIYNKNNGAMISGPTSMSSLAVGSNPCAAGAGHPIVLFDELANRWVFTELANGANVLCVYLSSGSDLSGIVTWTRYNFVLPSFPDAPRYGVWPDAYYLGANENNAIYAMDRQRMLAGQSATLQRFGIPLLSGFNLQMLQPADLAGTLAPSLGAPGIFMRHRDDEVHNAGSNNANRDFLEIFELHVDFLTPASSTVTGPISLPMSEMSSDLNGPTGFSAFPQPSGQKLDPLRETVMHRLTYRNLGTYEVLVGNLVTDLFLGAGSSFPNDTGAIRWFELRRPFGSQNQVFADGFENGAATNWVMHQEGTFAPPEGNPADQADRWMAASSVDKSGNIAMAYSIVRDLPAISAGLRYTGRLKDDPLGVMTAGENLIVNGSGSVSNPRWGDHADMGVDPVDGCTFWFIGNYSNGGSRANRFASFKFNECGDPGYTVTSPVPSVSICSNSTATTNAPPITINAAAANGFVGAVAMTYPNPFPTGVAGSFIPSVIPTLPGSSTAQLSASNAATPGTISILARGSSGALKRELQLLLTVATGIAPQPALTSPANTAVGVGATPTFSWAAAPQASNYLVEASTSASFGTTVLSQTVTGTHLVSPVALPTSQQIFWRVRANNVCGSTTSVVFSFNAPAFTMTTNTPSVAVCAITAAPSNAPPIMLDLQPVSGFVGNVTLSYPNVFGAGVSGTLNPTNQSVPGSSAAQLAASNAAASGAHTVLARAVAGAITRELSLILNVSTAVPAAATSTAPPNTAVGVSTSPTFIWTAVGQGASYVVEASISNTFASLLFSQATTATSLVSPVTLPPNTAIFWRVRAINLCGTGPDSAVATFTTANPQQFCRNVSVPIPDENAVGVNDNLLISGATGLVGDLDVRVELNHTYVADLAVRLNRAAGARRNLMTMPTSVPSGLCDGNHMAATFDDETSPPRPANNACVDGAVPTYAGVVTPEQSLDVFDGQDPNATWTLNVSDSVFQDTGTLTRWCITFN